MEIKRREFLRLFGGLSGATVIGGCAFDEVFEMPAQLVEQAKHGPRIESWKSTVCGLCPASRIVAMSFCEPRSW